ncbi:MAG TPA: hypothetical protein VJK53_03405 [Candidatus Paceibacterota bacterium]
MLSLFPQILFLAPLSAFVIRIALAILFAGASWRHISEPSLTMRVFAIVEIAVAATLVAGAWTQAVALGAAVLLLAGLFVPSLRANPRSTALLALVMCLSLLVTGAGAIAFDLPL